MQTVKVKIALEIDHDGGWCAYGDDNGGDWDEVMQAVDFSTTGPGGQRFWIEAEIPLPAAEPETVKGDAVPA